MQSSILSLAQTACYRMAIQAPSALLTATDTDSLQLLHLLKEVAEELRNIRTFPQQKKKYTFDLETSRSQYPLPIDFWSPVPLTHWIDDRRRRLEGPLTDSRFTDYTRGGIGASSDIAYRIFGPDGNQYTAGGQFEIDPPPSASGEELSFEYVSANLFTPRYWTPSTSYTLNDYVFSNGNFYKCDTGGTSSSTTAPSATTTTTNSITDGSAKWHYVSMLYETPLADTDICIFDDDIMIAGLKAKYLDGRGLDGADKAAAAYEKLKINAKNRRVGTRVGSFNSTPGNSIPYPRTPSDGSWNI